MASLTMLLLYEYKLVSTYSQKHKKVFKCQTSQLEVCCLSNTGAQITRCSWIGQHSHVTFDTQMFRLLYLALNPTLFIWS